MVDMHCDETDDPLSRHIEQLAYETQRLGLHGRVGRLAPDLDAFDGQLLRLEAVAADCRGRRFGHPQSADQHHHPGPPRHLSEAPRHDPRARKCSSAGIRVGFGQDCVLDPWYSLGTADMLDVAFMGLHVAQMTSPADMAHCFDMVTSDQRRDHGARPSRPRGRQERQPRRARRRQSRSRRCGCAPSASASSPGARWWLSGRAGTRSCRFPAAPARSTGVTSLQADYSASGSITCPSSDGT